jgi:hypothetical protein
MLIITGHFDDQTRLFSWDGKIQVDPKGISRLDVLVQWGVLREN